jgi:hypothetical protein
MTNSVSMYQSIFIYEGYFHIYFVYLLAHLPEGFLPLFYIDYVLTDYVLTLVSYV